MPTPQDNLEKFDFEGVMVNNLLSLTLVLEFDKSIICSKTAIIAALYKD